jgi:hypothetical protein
VMYRTYRTHLKRSRQVLHNKSRPFSFFAIFFIASQCQDQPEVILQITKIGKSLW